MTPKPKAPSREIDLIGGPRDGNRYEVKAGAVPPHRVSVSHCSFADCDVPSRRVYRYIRGTRETTVDNATYPRMVFFYEGEFTDVSAE